MVSVDIASEADGCINRGTEVIGKLGVIRVNPNEPYQVAVGSNIAQVRWRCASGNTPIVANSKLPGSRGGVTTFLTQCNLIMAGVSSVP